jgi:hypothetical protein
MVSPFLCDICHQDIPYDRKANQCGKRRGIEQKEAIERHLNSSPDCAQYTLVIKRLEENVRSEIVKYYRAVLEHTGKIESSMTLWAIAISVEMQMKAERNEAIKA